MGEETRKTGIAVIGNIPWGTHFCQFYQTKEDLIDILVPYFKAGLENNEFCMWVTSEPLKAEEAMFALGKAIKNLDDYIGSGQIEILDYTKWYTKTGIFEADKVLQGWVDKENQALRRGFDGLRLTGNTFWLEEKDWQNFTDYEEMVNSVIGKHRMLAICTYSLDKCGASEVIDVVKNHQFALIRREGKWELIESTERKRAEEELRESEEKFRSLFENMLNGFAYCKILVDEDNKPIDYIHLEVNDTWERLVGLKREDVVGKKITEVIPGIKESETDLISIYGKVALTGEATEFTLFFEPLGKWFAVSVYSPQKGYFVAVFNDITESKQVEETLRESEEFSSSLLENAPNPITVINPDTSIRYVNPALEKLTGFSSAELIGRKAPYPWWLEEDQQQYSRELEEVIRRGEYRRERFFQKKNGERFWVEITSIPVERDGELRHFLSIWIDITERKQAQEKEQQLQQELYLSSRLASIGELAAGVAHEINNPLTGIIGFSQLLLRKSTDEETSRNLEIIYNEAQRAAKVVGNLLTFARRREPKKEYSDIHDILQRALELRAYELKTSNIKVVTDFATTLPRVMADFQQIEEVFLNIILNAEQAMTEAKGGGKLSIKTGHKKGYVTISFTNDGPGIPAEHLDKVFDPFFTTKGDKGGTGLGLSICHGIVTEHGGKIYAKSKQGEGATFFVELPVATEEIDKN